MMYNVFWFLKYVSHWVSSKKKEIKGTCRQILAAISPKSVKPIKVRNEWKLQISVSNSYSNSVYVMNNPCE